MTTPTAGPNWFHGSASGAADGSAGFVGAPAANGRQTSEDRLETGLENSLENGSGNGLEDGDRPRAGDGVADQDPGDLLEEWTSQRRTNRLTAILAVALIATCTFVAGALVHKQFGSPGRTAAAGRTGGAPGGQGFPGGFPGGEGQAGAGGAPGGQPAGQSGQSSQSGQSGQSSQSSQSGQSSQSDQSGQSTGSAPAVVGTVTSVADDALVVENFAGKRVTVHVPATATVTVPGLTSLAAGMTVTVTGSAGSDGGVTATSVVARRVG